MRLAGNPIDRAKLVVHALNVFAQDAVTSVFAFARLVVERGHGANVLCNTDLQVQGVGSPNAFWAPWS